MSPLLTNLELEMAAAASRLTMGAVRQLVTMGADRRFVARLTGQAMIGVANVTLTGAGWEPEGPDRRLLVGVVHQGELVDVVAIASHQRDEWALRTHQGWALGADAIEQVHQAIASDMGAGPSGKSSRKPRQLRIRLHATPFDWLASGGDGVCVLDWCAASLMELRALGERVTLEVPPGGAERIKGLLAYGALPRVAETRVEYSGDIAA